jgi:hypothetical protein
MRDDFDSALADRFKVLDQVPVPDTWSRIRKTDRVLTMLDLETAAPTEPGTDPGSVTGTRDIATIDLEPPRSSGPRRRSRRITHVVLAIAVAAAVITTLVVISRDHTTAPADIPISVPSPLEEPSPDEVAAASSGLYPRGSGRTEVTATRSYVSLRSGSQGWAFATGSTDSPEVHYGLLGDTDDLALSALDDRLFVASSASLSQDPLSTPAAWLIDSVTGQRGALRWVDRPTTLDSAEQVVALFPAHPIPWYANLVYLPPSDQFVDSGARFLPRVVDRRDWTIRPLSVPDDATATLAIHQPGVGRIWIGTAPDGGHVGLAYTDDGGASWTDVELPPSLRFTSEAVLADPDDEMAALPPSVAATGDHVAVTEASGESDRPVFVSADGGENWNTARLDAADVNGRQLYVLSDDRLMVVLFSDLQAIGVLVSSSASNWSHLEVSDHSAVLAGSRSIVGGFQQGVVMSYVLSVEPPGSASIEGLPPVSFSIDLTDWWTIPGLELCDTASACSNVGN